MPAVTELPAPIAETLEPRVADGVLFFDHKAPGWASLVDLDRLDLRNPCLCVLGQIVGLAAVVDLPLAGVWDAAAAKMGIDLVAGRDAELGINSDAPELLGDELAAELADAAGYVVDGAPGGTMIDVDAYLHDVALLEMAALQRLWVAVIGPRQESAGVAYRHQLAQRQGARW